MIFGGGLFDATLGSSLDTCTCKSVMAPRVVIGGPRFARSKPARNAS